MDLLAEGKRIYIKEENGEVYLFALVPASAS